MLQHDFLGVGNHTCYHRSSFYHLNDRILGRFLQPEIVGLVVILACSNCSCDYAILLRLFVWCKFKDEKKILENLRILLGHQPKKSTRHWNHHFSWRRRSMVRSCTRSAENYDLWADKT